MVWGVAEHGRNSQHAARADSMLADARQFAPHLRSTSILYLHFLHPYDWRIIMTSHLCTVPLRAVERGGRLAPPSPARRPFAVQSMSRDGQRHGNAVVRAGSLHMAMHSKYHSQGHAPHHHLEACRGGDGGPQWERGTTVLYPTTDATTPEQKPRTAPRVVGP